MAHDDHLDLPPFLDRRNTRTLAEEGAGMTALAPKTPSAVVDLLPMRTALASATTPAEILAVDRQLEDLEAMMKAAGLYTDDQLREVREERCRARWALGRTLERVERGHGPGRGKKMSGDQRSFRKVIEQLSLDKSVALEAQRIGALPDVELEEVLAAARSRGEAVTFSELLIKARRYWHQASRQEKHRRIREEPTVIIHAAVISVGDGLFQKLPGQSWRPVGEEEKT